MLRVKSSLQDKMEGATDLSELLGSGPVQNPSLPASTTYTPITGGGDPFIAPINTSIPQKSVSQNNYDMFNTVKYAVKNLMFYVGVFIGAAVISFPTPRSLILQYIPHTYTSGGVPSYTGVAILAAVATAVTYLVGTLGSALF